MLLIVGFGQFVDLTEGAGVSNTFSVLLDSGEVVSISTDEDTVQQLIGLAGSLSPSVEVDAESFEGSGDVSSPYDVEDVEDVEEDDDVGREETHPTPRISSPTVDSDGFLVQQRAPTISKDSMGYPVVQQRSTRKMPVVDEDVGEQI
jgi:hypothetical protein